MTNRQSTLEPSLAPFPSPRQLIRDFIVETFFVDDFPDDASFLRTGIVDSMGMTQLVVFLEQEFGIAVADGELLPENLDSLDRVTVFVERKCRVAG